MDKDEERIARLEKTLRDFKIVASGVNVQAEFGNRDTRKQLGEGLLTERLSRLEKLHSDFQMIGGADVTVHGGLKTGCCVNASCGTDESDNGIPVTSTTPPPPPEECSCGLVVTFHDVVFDCGCITTTDGIASAVFTNSSPELFNEQPISLYRYYDLSGYPSEECPTCYYAFLPGSGSLKVHTVGYSGEGCTGDPLFETDAECAGLIELWRDGDGVWHITISYFTTRPLFFYGTSPSLSLPFTNELECSEEPVLWPNPDCTYDNYRRTASHGGTATVEIVNPCGACCGAWAEFPCVQETEDGCDYNSGTYQGDDVPCDPDPC